MTGSVIRRLLGRFSSDETHLYECRQCGRQLEESPESCPNCGSTEIARYDIDG